MRRDSRSGPPRGPAATLRWLLVITVLPGLVACAEVYRRLDGLPGGVQEAVCTVSEAVEIPRAEELFARLMRAGPDDGGLAQEWRALGFELEAKRLDGDRILTVSEAAGGCRGRGRYAFRAGSPRPPLALQAPHGNDDLDTGTIAARLFAEGPYAAAGWNTVPRATVDLAHLRASHFNAFTRAFGRVHPDGLVVQLHGFAREKRSTTEGRGADLILSDATRTPGPAARVAAECLRADIPGRVRLYPKEVRELGGTTNANARALREIGLEGRFLHLELSRELRLRLRDDAAVRRDVTGCLIEAANAIGPFA